MTNSNTPRPAPELPTDVWAQIAKRLPIRSKAQLSLVNRAAAQGTREAWGPADYFEAAQARYKRDPMRVPHRPAALGDGNAWFLVTREMHLAKQDPDSAFYDRIWDDPVEELMALARNGYSQPEEMWLRYRNALIKAGRPAEARIFSSLLQQRDTLRSALEAGELETVRALLDAGIPMPESDVIAPAIERYPEATAMLAAYKVWQWNVTSSFLKTNEVGQRSILACKPLMTSCELLTLYRCVRCETRERLTRFFLLCTPEQLEVIMKADPQEAGPVKSLVIGRALGDYPEEAEVLAALLPVWIRECDTQFWPHLRAF